MKNEFLEYFKSLGIEEPVVPRIETIMEYFNRFFPEEEIIDVFVSEYVEKDGTRIYEDLRFFGKDRDLLARNFMNVDEFYIARHERGIVSLKIEAKNYDFKKATDKSRLSVRKFYTYPSINEQKASMGNCDHLLRICQKYFVTSFVTE